MGTDIGKDRHRDRHGRDIRLSIKKYYDSGIAAGWLKKGVTGDIFFHFYKNLFFPPEMDNISYPKKKNVKKKNCGCPTGFNFSHLLDRKQTFFYGQSRDRQWGRDGDRHREKA